jgi:hypothetical protein
VRVWFRSSRRVLLPTAAIALITLAGLLIAGSRHLPVRTASADAPNQIPIAALRRGHVVCEGPLISQGAARSVGIWGGAASRQARLRVTVKDASTQQILASGALKAVAQESEWTARLDRDVPGNHPVEICLAGTEGTFALSGSASSDPRVAETGTPGGPRFSLVLLSDGNRSLLGSLSLAFSRASLWRFSWVGAWTFWVLAIALLMAFGLAVVAVIRAADDDEPRPPGPPEPPVDDLPSETREDRPQPVT